MEAMGFLQNNGTNVQNYMAHGHCQENIKSHDFGLYVGYAWFKYRLRHQTIMAEVLLVLLQGNAGIVSQIRLQLLSTTYFSIYYLPIIQLCNSV
jgi:hypothetical protein